MKIIIVRDYEEMSARAAEIVDGFIRRNSRVTIGLPTGNTPTGMYRLLVGRHRAQRLDFAGVTTFNLDEYWGLAPDHPASFAWYIRTNFLDHVNIPPGRSHWPSSTGDAQLVCREYEEAVRREGGLDLAILGIGANGHIAFNEPGTPFSARTHVARLTEETRRIAARGPEFQRLEDVPEAGITMGIATIMEAKTVLLLASGPAKAKAVAGAVAGPVTEDLPASVLQRHGDVTVVVDEAAAAALPGPRS